MPAKGWKGRFNIRLKRFSGAAMVLVDLSERRLHRLGLIPEDAEQTSRAGADGKVIEVFDRQLLRTK